MNTGFLQQQPLLASAAVRSAPSPQHGAQLDIRTVATRPVAEEKSFAPAPRQRTAKP